MNRRRHIGWTMGILTAGCFFVIWQSELIFALFCSLSFAFFLWLSGGVRRGWRGLACAVGGSLLSMSAFALQLVSYAGFGVFSVVAGTIKERNTVLYAARPRSESGFMSDSQLVKIFRDYFSIADYLPPRNWGDF